MKISIILLFLLCFSVLIYNFSVIYNSSTWLLSSNIILFISILLICLILWKIYNRILKISLFLDNLEKGNLEYRITKIPKNDIFFKPIRSLSNFVDIVDAFVRESCASVETIGSEQYTRRIYLSGFRGSFLSASKVINRAISLSEKKGMIMDKAIEAVIICNKKGNIILYNKSAEKIFLQKKDKAIDYNIEQIFENNSGKKSKILDLVAKSDGKNIEVPFYINKKQKLTLSVSVVHINIEHNLHYSLLIRDISDIKLYQKQINDNLKIIEFANQEKDRFLSLISHELFTPLNAISGYIQILHQSAKTEKEENYTNKISYNCDYLLDMVSNILNLSQIEMNKDKYLKGSIYLEDGVNQVLDKISKKDNYIYKNIPNILVNIENVPIDISKDAFEQILTNLVDNAIKFGDKKDINIISEKITYRKKKYCKIMVVDQGISVKNEYKDRLFEKFSQLDMSTTRKYGGLGVGLTICKILVEDVGGKINCYNNKDKGSTFWFTVLISK